MEIRIPYGHSFLTAELPDHIEVDVIRPRQVSPAADPVRAVHQALKKLEGGADFAAFAEAGSAAIAVNDKTRPVPNQFLLPPLLDRLHELGLAEEQITFYIAGGSHPPLSEADFPAIFPPEILGRYKILSHDSEDRDQLVYLGKTTQGTQVWTNRGYLAADIRITVGNLAPHQFAGFSGGVKTAAIGLSGLETIKQNHILMTHQDSRLGEIDKNPLRRDIEEIGQLIGVELALNVILNAKKEIVSVIAGTPRAVMDVGVPLSRQIFQVDVPCLYPLVIASPGGYPKDINVYQSQKAFSSAVRITRPGGMVIIAAACPEGSGSAHYENWVRGMSSLEEVRNRFVNQEFQIGPHKAYQWARDEQTARFKLCSDMSTELAESLLLNPVDDLQTALDSALTDLNHNDRVAVLPQATSTIANFLE